VIRGASGSGAADAALLAWGDFLFRWRSYLPLALVPLVVAAVARFQHPIRTHLGDLAWEALCVLVALAGVAIRVVVVGFAAPGTSGRNTRHQKARALNTTGAYSVVRHPLYVGNTVIVLGLALFPHTWLAPPAVAVLALAYYACIGRREEAFLRERFGQAFETWAARVPAIVPSPARWIRPDRPFDWRLVLRREFYAAALVLVVPMLLDVVEDFHEEGVLRLDPVWTAAAALGAGLFVGLRSAKKRARPFPG
jgi:protein-S-isoprenylcysteine O-methyltransferase Ste14